jgi:multicomponent Na+:H+ antiporter subunit G
MIDWISGGLFIVGATLALLAGVGVLRMPDVFTRMQASTKASTLGLGCLLAGVALRNPEFAFVVRAGSIAAFMLLTGAVAAHVIARAAGRGGAPLW